MNLLDRYVAAVKRYLPPASREDVGRELHSLLEERLDAEAEKLGRPLTDDDVAAVLKQHGHPYKVAASYGRRKVLVGANAFALYKRTLITTSAVWLMGAILVGLYDIFFHEGTWAAVAVPAFWHTVVDVLLFLFFAITLIFHVMGEVLDRSGLGWRFNPRKLPTVDGTWFGVSLVRLVVNTLIVMSFLGLITASSYAYQSPEASVAIGESVVKLIPALQFLALTGLLVNSVNLFQRYWTRTKLYVSAVAAGLTALLLGWIVLFDRVLLLSEHGATARDWGNTFLSFWPEAVLKVLLAAAVVLLVLGALRSWRLAQTPRLPVV